MNEGHVIFQFSKITNQIYLGTNLCCLSKTHTQVLVDLQIYADIDLEIERQNQIPFVNSYLWLPVKDHDSPSQTQLNIGVSVIDSLVKNNKKVYIHCKDGHGRSPTLLAAYFINQGMNVDKAIETIKLKRAEIHLWDPQIKALNDYFETNRELF